MKKIVIFLVMAMSMFFIGCGSGSSKSNTTNVSSSTIVDPYIVDAVLCEDKNNNNICEAYEQKSTPSDINGLFKFPYPLLLHQ